MSAPDQPDPFEGDELYGGDVPIVVPEAREWGEGVDEVDWPVVREPLVNVERFNAPYAEPFLANGRRNPLARRVGDLNNPNLLPTPYHGNAIVWGTQAGPVREFFHLPQGHVSYADPRVGLTTVLIPDTTDEAFRGAGHWREYTNVEHGPVGHVGDVLDVTFTPRGGDVLNIPSLQDIARSAYDELVFWQPWRDVPFRRHEYGIRDREHNILSVTDPGMAAVMHGETVNLGRNLGNMLAMRVERDPGTGRIHHLHETTNPRLAFEPQRVFRERFNLRRRAQRAEYFARRANARINLRRIAAYLRERDFYNNLDNEVAHVQRLRNGGHRRVYNGREYREYDSEPDWTEHNRRFRGHSSSRYRDEDTRHVRPRYR